MQYRLNGDVKETVKSAIQGYQKGRRGVQNAAVSVLVHALNHGDYSQAQVLCDGVGNKSLVKFFEDFGGLLVNAESSSFEGWRGADHIGKNLEAAKKQMYWEYKAENIWAGHDDLKAAKSLISKHNAAVKRLEKEPENADKVSFHPALIAALEAAIEAVEAA